MAKIKVEFACTACGTSSPRWVGKCPGCGEWNTLVEEVAASSSPRQRTAGMPDFPVSRPVRLTEVGRQSCLAPLGDTDAGVLHWHGDTFDLPAGAVHLATTELCRNQAFSLGTHALALQFHLEATATGLESWYVGHTAEIAATPGVSVGALRADSRRFAAGLATRAETIFGRWLDGAGL